MMTLPMGLFGRFDDHGHDPGPSRMTGAVIGVVTNNSDPDGMGRVKLRFPWLTDSHESSWARVAAPMAGNNRGAYFLPEIDDEVLVVFEQGDMRFPFVLGSLWNGKDKAPADNTDGKNNLRLIKSRSGHVIKLNDEDGKETIEIIDGSTRNSLVIDTASNTITFTAGKDIVLSAPQGTIRLDAQNIQARCSADASLEASGSVTIQASGAMKLQGSRVDIN